MWPLERKRDILRIGRQCAEYWRWAPAEFALQARLALNAEPGVAETLEAELRSWLQSLDSEIARSKPVDVVLESAWLPAMLVEAGRSTWNRDQVERLLRHRITELYLQPGAPIDGWGLQLDHRPGDAQALGYALAPTTQQAVTGAMVAAGWRAASLQPALAWARQRLERRGRRLRTGWWVWCEQDRAIVSRIESGRITAMNTGAAVPSDEDQCERLAAIEAARWGVLGASDRAVMVSWEDLAAPPEDAAKPLPSRKLGVTT